MSDDNAIAELDFDIVDTDNTTSLEFVDAQESADGENLPLIIAKAIAVNSVIAVGTVLTASAVLKGVDKLKAWGERRFARSDVEPVVWRPFPEDPTED